MPHHRRRRRFALAGLLVLAVLAAVTLGGSTRTRHAAAGSPPPGFFGRVQTLAGTARNSFAGEQQAALNGAIDRTLSYTPYVRVAGGQHREIALTFDDGPGPFTQRIVAVLLRRRVPATFFEVGLLDRYFHASTTEIAQLGYPIGDHTFSHAPMSRLSPTDQRAQLLQDAGTLTRYGAPFPRLFRPPYGMWNAATLALLHRNRMLMVLWTVDTSDYRRPGVKAIVASALAAARPGAIILLHDAGGDRSQTLAALPKIISGLQARGYKLVTVPALLLDNPPPAAQQVVGLRGAGG